MNDLPREKLAELIESYGPSLCEEPQRCEAFLRDFCPGYRREVFVLVNALREQVAVELLAPADLIPFEIVLARLTRRLEDHMALSEQDARWAVESWARALGKVPGPPRRRALHLIWIVDCSASMAEGGKMEVVNETIRQTVPCLRDEALLNPWAEVFVRAITFSAGAQWHIEKPTPVHEFEWVDVEPQRGRDTTDLGEGLVLAAEALGNLPRRSWPPTLILLTDGKHTDAFSKGYDALLTQPWGKRAARRAIPIGRDANYAPLRQFVMNPEEHGTIDLRSDEVVSDEQLQNQRIVSAEDPLQLMRVLSIRWYS